MSSKFDIDDDDVIFCEPQVETMDLSDVSEEAGPSRTRKLSEVISISDSDGDDDDSVVIIKDFSSAVLSDSKSKEIQGVVTNIKLMFGKDSKVDIASVNPTLWQSLCQILDISGRESKDFRPVRAKVVESGVIKVIFDCLSAYTHHFSEVVTVNVPDKPTTSRAPAKKKAPAKVYNRWSQKKDNGTGFGSGATVSTWKPEDYQKKRDGEEKHITSLLQILASFMNPQDDIPSDSIQLPNLFVNLVEQSCLVTVLRSYLRNDSVLDMTQHIPLYRSITLLVRALSVCNQLVHLLMIKQDDTDEPIAELLGKIKVCTEAYKGRVNGIADDDWEVNIFIEDILTTSFLVESATFIFMENKLKVENLQTKSAEEKYLEVMKKLQFDSFEMIEKVDDTTRFTVTYHYEKDAHFKGIQGGPARIKRLAQEQANFHNSLPLSYSSSVFVRSDTSRMDVMKFLVTGPTNTPYENGCFIFDAYFPPEYPNEPPQVYLETTGRHTVRFNPNLYNCGKVCLSLLNTWSGRPEEKWNAKTSSFLQVLVSIQSLILVDDPYFNEPGYQAQRGNQMGKEASINYNKNLYPSTVQWAMIDQMRNPTPCFKDVIQRHFFLKRNEIMEQVNKWSQEVPSMAGQRATLAQEFLNLPILPGLENFNIDTPEMNRKVLEKIATEKPQENAVAMRPSRRYMNPTSGILPSLESFMNSPQYNFPTPLGQLNHQNLPSNPSASTFAPSTSLPSQSNILSLGDYMSSIYPMSATPFYPTWATSSSGVTPAANGSATSSTVPSNLPSSTNSYQSFSNFMSPQSAVSSTSDFDFFSPNQPFDFGYGSSLPSSSSRTSGNVLKPSNGQNKK